MTKSAFLWFININFVREDQDMGERRFSHLRWKDRLKIEKMLKEFGFTHYTIFRQREPVLLPL